MKDLRVGDLICLSDLAELRLVTRVDGSDVWLNGEDLPTYVGCGRYRRPEKKIGMWVRNINDDTFTCRISEIMPGRINFTAYEDRASGEICDPYSTSTYIPNNWVPIATPGSLKPVNGSASEPATVSTCGGENCPGCPSWRPQGPCAKCKAELLAEPNYVASEERDPTAHIKDTPAWNAPIPGWDRSWGCVLGLVYIRDDVTHVEIRHTAWKVVQRQYFPDGWLEVSEDFITPEAAMKWADCHLPRKTDA